jgi:16S rRNA (guanine1207-N2)-methyltransferase
MPRSSKTVSGKSKSNEGSAEDRLLARSKEALLASLIDEIVGRRVLCTTLSRGRFAQALVTRRSGLEVTCFFLDVFLAQQAREEFRASRHDVQVLCETDFPEGPFDVVVLPFFKNGEAELTRELMQQAHERLDLGGRLYVSSDNPQDAWLLEQMQTLFKKVTRMPQSRGIIYSGMKTERLRRIREFSATFAFRDGDRLIRASSRPGVFSHRKLDLGARALLEATASAETLQRGDRILDLGCGSGAVGLALAMRVPGVHVHGVDSNPRALQCLLRGAELNGLAVSDLPTRRLTRATQSSVSVQLDANGHIAQPGSFDLVVANPPYYSDWAITAIFVEAAARALRPGGKLFLVTKNANWYRNNLPFVLSQIEVQKVREYSIVTAVQKSRD